MMRLLFLLKQIRERTLQVAVAKIAVPHDAVRSVHTSAAAACVRPTLAQHRSRDPFKRSRAYVFAREPAIRTPAN